MASIAQKQRIDVSANMVAAGLRAFFEIKKKWGLTNDQAMVLLGAPPKSTYFKWQGGNPPRTGPLLDLATRLSYVLGIFKALEILYQQSDLADKWISKPNLAFGGESALDRMMGGQITDLAEVRDYLDSVRGGW